MQTVKRPDGHLVLVLGASRAGKTQYVLWLVRASKRLLVWDVSGQYAARYGLKSLSTLPELARWVQAQRGAARVAYVPRSLDEFNGFCRCAFAFGLTAPGTVVVEEVAASTNAGKARGQWGRLVNQSLKSGLNLLVTAQRVAEIDKSVFGNASVITIFRQNTVPDAERLASDLRLSLSDIPDADVEYLQRLKDRTITKWRLQFVRNKPTPQKIKAFSRSF